MEIQTDWYRPIVVYTKHACRCRVLVQQTMAPREYTATVINFLFYSMLQSVRTSVCLRGQTLRINVSKCTVSSYEMAAQLFLMRSVFKMIHSQSLIFLDFLRIPKYISSVCYQLSLFHLFHVTYFIRVSFFRILFAYFFCHGTCNNSVGR